MSTTTSPETAVTTPTKKGFGRTFWTLNTIEMWERLAYYNLRVVAPIYIMQADDPGGLHLTAGNKGSIYAWWAAFQSLLPIVTGGYADRFGYKRTLFFSVSMMMAGYLLIAFLRDVPGISNYWGLFAGIMVLGTGTAFFKPSIQGSLAHTLDRSNSSVGWGVFYWVVNVGAFVGHFVPGVILSLGPLLPEPFRTEAHSPAAWRNLFIASALFTSLNLLTLLTCEDVPSGASKTESAWTVLVRTLRDVIQPRLLAWLLIMSCFWFMMFQLWDLQPNFIADWVDSGPMVDAIRWLPGRVRQAIVEETPRGPMMAQQVLLSFNAFFIILGVVGVAWLTRRMRTLTAMIFGMLLATAGVLVAGLTATVWVFVAGVLFFSLGEMMTGPKKSEYLSLIAPPDKKGLYLGYVNIPVGLGILTGSTVAGYVYGHFGEKAMLALRYLAEKTSLGEGLAWNGDVTQLEKVLEIKRPDAMLRLQEMTGLDPIAATQLLWDTYHPQLIWIPFAIIGVVATVALYIFAQRAKRWSDMNA